MPPSMGWASAAGVATGIQFGRIDRQTLAHAIDRAVALYGDRDEWRRIQRNGMRCDFSWQASGKAYADLYRSLIG